MGSRTAQSGSLPKPAIAPEIKGALCGARFAGLLQSPLTDSNRRPSLPCDFGGNRRQLVAKRFGLLRWFRGSRRSNRLPFVAPSSFHRLSILFRQEGGLRLAAVTTVGAEIRRPCSPRCAVPMQRRRVDRPVLRHAVARLSGHVSYPPLASRHSRSVCGRATDHRNEPLNVRRVRRGSEAEDSRRFELPNLGEAVRVAVGEMCPNPAPATSGTACKWELRHLRGGFTLLGGSEARAGCSIGIV